MNSMVTYNNRTKRANVERLLHTIYYIRGKPVAEQMAKLFKILNTNASTNPNSVNL